MKLKTLSLLCISICTLAVGQKKPLDHDVYDLWPSIKGSAISRDGKWLLYTQGPAVGDSELLIKSLSADTVYKVPRGMTARFMYDGRYVLTTIVPEKAEVDKAKKEKKKPNEMPKNVAAFVDLSTGKVTNLDNVTSYRIAEEDKGWIAYMPDTTPPGAAASGGTTPGGGGVKPEEPKKDDAQPQKKKEHAVGKQMVLFHVPTGKKIEVAEVVDYTFNKQGDVVVFSRSTKDGKEDGVYRLTLSDAKTTPVITGLGNYRSITISDKTGAIAFLSDRDDYKAAQPSHSVYVARAGAAAEMVAKEGSPGVPAGWWVSNRSSLSFSESGNRVMFRTVAKPAAEAKKDEVPDDEKVVVDVWNWKDPELQPMQLLGAEGERNRTYSAMYDLGSRRVIQLETPEFRSVSVGSRGDSNFAIAADNQPYRQLLSWDDTYADFYLVNIKTGERSKILEKQYSPPGVTLSPDSKYAVWYDSSARAWFSMDTTSGEKRNVTAKISQPLFDVEDDHPALPGAYGSAGWTKNDERFLVYDQFDLWSCDPSGQRDPVCVTDGLGRSWNIRLRAVRLDREVDYVDPDQPLLLSAVNRNSMAAGFYRDRINGRTSPQRLLMDDKAFGMPNKADDANVVYLTRQTFTEFPDLWVTDLDFKNLKKMSDVNQLQKQYNWGTSEIIEWTSLNGQNLKGILRKPEDFDPMKTYPMIVYFYETLSDTLHNYRSPGPSGGAGISPIFYASRGYIVFEPDIPFKVGYPGQSSKDSIVPGVAAVIAKGYVDPKRVAIHGHSWGGYQTAFLVTQTDMFRCAVAGAAVTNMTSAYGGIRWGSGMVRQMQYEKGQSRIGGSLWERPLQYIENSPIFWAEKINTPLLMLHNDQDDAVPWYQSIELFTALRRLGKPAWMLNYNGEFHGIRKRQNAKDWSVRMQQFFDHYLKDAPPPVWLVEGIPATEKGKTLGLDLVKKGGN